MPRPGTSSLPASRSFAALVDALPTKIRASLRSIGDSSVTITGITDDSRAVRPGFCFVAYLGVASDGRSYIQSAINNGAVAVLLEADGIESDNDTARQRFTAPIRATVSNGREMFAWLCASWHGFPSKSFKVIGITGTDGKTTTGTILFNILRAAGHKVGLISTVNAVIDQQVIDTGLHTTTPDADDLQELLARMRDARVTYCVLEVTSHGLAHHRVDGTNFNVAVITNITHDHINLHGSREAYREAKARLFKLVGPTGTAILNADDDYSYSYLASIPVGETITYARQRHGASIRTNFITTNQIQSTASGMVMHVQASNHNLQVQTQLIGAFNVSNILAAVGAAYALKVSDSAIVVGIAATRGVPGRMEPVDAGQAFRAFVDFAHTPNALESCLSTLAALKGDGQLTVVFGCAGERDVQKRPLMAEIAARLSDNVIFTVEDPRREDPENIFAEMLAGVPANRANHVTVVPDRLAALQAACSRARPGDIVVACGKGHEQSMCFGTREVPWDDRIQLRQAIMASAAKTEAV